MLIFTGTGSSHCIGLGNCCAHLWAGEDLLLIDCGEDTFSSPVLQQSIRQCQGNIYCIITHLHSDHVGSLATLCLYCKDTLHKTVRVCFPTNEASALLSLMGVPQTHFIESTSFPLKLDNDLEVVPTKTSHVPWMNCYGYFLHIDKACYYYSGDANCLSMHVLTMLKDSTLTMLYQDVTLNGDKGGPHLTLDELCSIVPDGPMRDRIVVMHFDSMECMKEAKRRHFCVAERKSIS